MARDDRGARLPWRLLFVSALDETRPSGIPGWVSPVAPVVAQAAVGAGHWAAGRRQRALAAWTSAAGFALVAWGLGTEAPAQAEAQQDFEQHKDLMRQRGIEVPATAAQAFTGRAAAQAEDGRRISPGHRRIGSPAAGSIG